MSITMQFDGSVSDPDKLKQELKAAGAQVAFITRSRWRTLEGEDKGTRIDIELEDDGGDIKAKLLKLEDEMNKNKSWDKNK